jgi:hypothetical protein
VKCFLHPPPPFSVFAPIRDEPLSRLTSDAIQAGDEDKFFVCRLFQSCDGAPTRGC